MKITLTDEDYEKAVAEFNVEGSPLRLTVRPGSGRRGDRWSVTWSALEGKDSAQPSQLPLSAESDTGDDW